jgi:putative ABC transport system permease protein
MLRRVNLRHVRERKLRTSLTVAGVAAGVALVFSVAIINATLSSSFETSLRTLAGIADVEVSSADTSGLSDASIAAIERVDGVERAVPALRVVTRIAGPKGEVRALMLGITPAFGSLYERPGAPPAVSLAGDFGAAGDGLVLSERAAAELGAGIGDAVRVTTPRGIAHVSVTGTVGGEGVLLIQGGRLGVMTLDAARTMLDRAGRLDFVWVTARPGASIDAVQRGIARELGGAAVVGRPGERARGFERALGAVATMTSLAGTAALFVALFVVFNATSISLMERRRELAMALALGGSRRQLFAAFLGEATVLGALSSAVGVGAGFVIARLLVDGFATQARILGVAPGGDVVVKPSAVAIAFCGGLAVAIAGAFVPARRILRVTPIESLRPEAALEWVPPRTRRRARLSLATGIVTFAIGAGGGVLAARVPEERWAFSVAIVFLMAGVSMLLPHAVPLIVRGLRGVLARAFGTVGRLAADALEKNPARTTLTVGTLVITAALVVAVNSSFDSYGVKLRESARLWNGAPLVVSSDSFAGFVSDQPLSASLRSSIEAVEGVSAAYPMRYLSLDVDGEQVVIYAMSVAEASRDGIDSLTAVEGLDQSSFLAAMDAGELVIARFTAQQRNLEVGDQFALPTPGGRRSFRVAGIMDDLNGFESASVDYRTYLSVWKSDATDQFFVFPDPGVSPATAAGRLEEMLRRDAVPAIVRTQAQVIEDLVVTVLGLLSLARLIGFAALIVAAITIANTMFTAVLERKWEFGLQRAVGMGRRQLGRSVMLEAGVIGALGGAGAALLGAAMGFLMIRGMQAAFAWRVPFRTPVSLILFAIAGGAVLAAAAGSYPRRLAVRTPIIEALRYE